MTTTPDILVSTDWLAQHLGQPDVLVFDCTTRLVPDAATIYRADPSRAQFEAAHIPGAQFIDVQQDLSENGHRYKFMLPGVEQFAAAMVRFGISAHSRVVLYSAGDPWWATRVWWLLRYFGFDRAAVLDGGLQKWQSEGRALEVGPAVARTPGNFVAVPRPQLVAFRDDVLAAIEDPQVCTLSARLPSQFAGRDGNNYGRAGRIAGSENLPAASLYDPVSNTLLPADRLREKFAPLGLQSRKVIAYCGHGIAASADVFALTLLGHPDVVLYDASLSEWADESQTVHLPMAVD